MNRAEPLLIVPSEGIGSLQHFWHLNMGLLMPLLYKQLAGELDGRAPYVASCGPVMDGVLRETLPMVFPEFEILSNKKFEAMRPATPACDLRRWDTMMLDPTERIDVKVRIRKIAAEIPGKFPWVCACGGRRPPDHAVLLLERSDPHEFYSPAGAADIKGYGKSRRAIANLRQCAEALSIAGHAVHMYEPGRHSYCCQLHTFASVPAIAGIRGAEFANLVWAKPGTRVYMVCPGIMTGDYQRIMAWCKDLEMHEQKVNGNTPDIDLDQLRDFLQAFEPIPGNP